MADEPPCPPTLGVILAGGLGRRMGGVDKALLRLGGETLLHHVARRLAPQCSGLIVNANDDPTRFGSLDFPVVPDTLPGHLGPLAGLLAALEWTAAHRPDVQWVASAPGDTPFLPKDLVRRLHGARRDAGTWIACAVSDGRLHPPVGLWPVHLRKELHEALTHGSLRSVRDWAEPHGVAHASWDREPIDPFFNINTPGDLAAADAMLESIPND